MVIEAARMLDQRGDVTLLFVAMVRIAKLQKRWHKVLAAYNSMICSRRISCASS